MSQPQLPAKLTLTDPAEIEHMLKWRQYQQWVKILPPGLTKPIQHERNEQCSALGVIQRAT